MKFITNIDVNKKLRCMCMIGSFCVSQIVLRILCYRHVILPPDIAKHVPKSHLMTETEWRNLGVQQSPGWVHYMMHSPGNIQEYDLDVLFVFFSVLPQLGRYFMQFILQYMM